MAKSHIITGLDIGTHSIKILVVRKEPSGSGFEVLAYEQEPSFGVRRGVVVDVSEVSKRIRSVVERAENSSGQKIETVYVNLSGGHISVIPSHGTIVASRADKKISQEDIERVIQASQAFSLPLNKEILEVFPKEFIVDGVKGIKEPLGMEGVRLEAEVLVLCAFSPYLKALSEAVLEAGLQINDVTISPLAASKAVLSPRQKELGVVLIDIGAGTTGLALFEEGNLIHTSVFPVGSAHITNDIAIGLQTEVEIAERIKREFGTCILEPSQRSKKIKLSQAEPTLIFSQKMLTDIITARVLEIFNLVQKELKKVSSQTHFPAGVVLTGGGAILPKITELARKELKLSAKLGKPKSSSGEDELNQSVVWGLVLTGADLEEDTPAFGKGMITWLKKIFRVFVP